MYQRQQGEGNGRFLLSQCLIRTLGNNRHRDTKNYLSGDENNVAHRHYSTVPASLSRVVTEIKRWSAWLPNSHQSALSTASWTTQVILFYFYGILEIEHRTFLMLRHVLYNRAKSSALPTTSGKEIKTGNPWDTQMRPSLSTAGTWKARGNYKGKTAGHIDRTV